jgi:predicted exporter
VTSTERRQLAFGAVVVAALGAFVAARMTVVTDITSFLPAGDDPTLSQLSREIASSELSRTMVLTLEAPDPDRAVAASRALEAALRADPRVGPHLAFLEGGPPEGVDRALWDLYHPRRLSLLAPDAAAARERLTDQALTDAALELKRRLGLPMSTLISRVAPSDPLLSLPGLFDRLEASRGGGVAIHEGRFVTEDRRFAVLFLATREAAFDGAVQAPLLDALDDAMATVQRELGAPLTLQRSGVNRFAVDAERSIKADIARVSIFSALGLVLLFLALFRSLRLAALASLPVGVGMLSALAVCLAAFGSVHGLTLAFGASLIGVSIDYTVHFYCHHTLSPAGVAPAQTLSRLWPGLRLGALTTIAGFIGLAWSAFPGLREVAVFATVGIVSALAATRWLVPPLVPRQKRPTRAILALSGGLARALAALRRRRRALWVLPTAAVALTALAAPRVHWDDDMASLNALDPVLLAEDEAVRARVAPFEQQRFVIAWGPDDEAALAANDRAARALAIAQSQGAIGGFRTVAPLLPSAAAQRAVDAVVRSSPDLWTRLSAAFVAAGFRAEPFAPFRELLAAPPPPPLTWDDLASSPLAPLVRSFRITLDHRVAYLSFLQDVRDPAALGAALVDLPGVLFLDQDQLFRSTTQAVRVRTTEVLLAGLVFILLLVAARYRTLRRTLAATLPALLAAAVTVAVLAVAGKPLNLVALTSLLMVVSMGVDYGVFMAESATHHPDELPATLMSLLVACLSTVFGFGLLALSSHPALETIGLIAGVGVTASFILAPATLTWLAPKRAS